MTRLAVIIFSLMCFVGCSLVDPFVTRGIRPGRSNQSDSKLSGASSRSGSVSLREAMDYAAEIKDAYRGGLREQALLQSWLGIGLIPLTAAAIGVGARGNSPNAVLGMGLAGASAFGVGTWLYNKPYQLAWIAGIKAVTCAEDAVRPFGRIDVVSLSANLDALNNQIGAVKRQANIVALIIDRFKAELAKLSVEDRRKAPHFDDLLKEAEVELTRSNNLAAAAASDYASWLDLLLQTKDAGEALRIAIDKITDIVDELIVANQRDPQALASIIGGLGASYKTFTTVPEGVKVKGPQPKIAAHGEVSAAPAAIYVQLADALDKMRDEYAQLDAIRRKVAGVARSLTNADPNKALEGCGLKPGDVVMPLSTNPAGPVELAKSGTISIRIAGGIPAFHPIVTGPSDAVKATYIGMPESRLFSVSASKDALSGDYTLNFVDKGGQVTGIQITVPPDKPSSSPTTPGLPLLTGEKLQERFDLFVTDITGKSVSTAGVTLKVGDPTLEADKAVVPVIVESVKQLNIQSFTEPAVRKAILAQSKSGIAESQVTIKDFAKVQADAKAKAKTEKPVPPRQPGKTSTKTEKPATSQPGKPS